jgi:hypothetical protein
MSGIVNSAGSKSGVIGTTELDYEEGDYTYTLPFSGSGSITPRTGYTKLKYIKIGRMCNIFGKVETIAESSPSGQMRITLPFTAGTCADSSATTNSSGIYAYFRSHAGSEQNYMLDVQENTAYAQFWRGSDSGNRETLTEIYVDYSFELYLTISYHTAT